MTKKLSTVLGIFIFMCLVSSFFITLSSNETVRAVLNFDNPDDSFNESDSDYDELNGALNINALFSAVSASDAANNLLMTACGVNVSDTDLSLNKSALNVAFVPQEPNYVERFRNYDGQYKATFVPVLMYHYFYDADKTTDTKITKNTNYHSIQSVRKQLKWLYENSYVTITMDELYEWLQGNIELPEKCVLLTSDDGQDNFYTLLQPELKKYGFIATSFVITSKQKNTTQKLLMTNIEMHSHTDDMHKGSVSNGGFPKERGIIQGISIENGVKDMTTSSEKLGGSKYMAYPYGNYGGNAKTILKKAGYKLAFTTTPGVVKRGMDPLELPRVRVSGSVDLDKYPYVVRDDVHKKNK